METSEVCQPANGSSMPVPFSYGLSSAPRFSTVTAAFYHHVAARPHEVAARDLSVTPPSEISYGDLARRSSKLAHKLRSLGVAPGDRVPLVVKRGIDMLVGIIAVLSCRAQYVPLDGSVVPDATLRFVLQQTQSKIALALKSTRHRLSEMGESSVVAIDDFEYDGSSESDLPQGVPEDGCYVIYTSGTTGTPKGVDVTHQNVTNLVCQSPGDLGIKPGTRVGQVLSISFDMAAWEMLGCLCNGGTLVLRGSDWKKAVKEVNVLICTPSILTKFRPEENLSIKVVATAGEPSSQLLADMWASSCTYYNCCGPTETTIVNTMHDHKPNRPLTIGKPTPNNNVYILDEDNKPVKIGEPGVMWAGGLGVTRGYVDLPEKTDEKYIADPFKADGSKMYNTGDLCKWNTDGSVQILGRIDDQVKVKGFRVELDGVAASLSACPTVQRATALLIDGEIHGFLTPKTCDLEKVAADFKSRQPYYAIPSQFHLLDAFPLTGNGKIDKKALKATELQNRQTAASEKTSSDKTSTEVITFPKHVFFGHTRTDSSTSSMTNVLTASRTTTSETTASSIESMPDLEKGIPEKQLGKRARGLRHRVLIVYRRLFTLVGLFNIAAAMGVIFTGFPREWLGTITAINLAVAVLIRQDFIINALYTITCSVPKSWPMFIRSRCAKIIHLGGVHSGAAVSAGAWLFASNVGDVVCMSSQCGTVWGHQSVAAQVISWILTALFCVMLVMAYPTIRKSHHNLFEKTHRFVGWTMLGLFWAQVVLTSNDTKAAGMTLGGACVRSPSFWLLLVASCSVACSWLFLKKVPVQSEVLSEHAIRLHFDFAMPVNGTFTRLSKRPLLEWHSFATIPAPQVENGRPIGHSLVVSNAGDWTKSTIQEAPTHLWTRGVPTCGVMRIATLFNRVVLIATGSGIGPCLGHIQDPSCPTQLIWSTSRPETTFGTGLCDAIRSKVPNAVIHDTKKLGRPDLVKMGYNLAKSFKAEAVIVIANEKITKKIVYGLETRGVPAYGAIWDS